MKIKIVQQVERVLTLGMTVMLMSCLVGCGSVSDNTGDDYQDALVEASEALNAIEEMLDDVGVTTQSPSDVETMVATEESTDLTAPEAMDITEGSTELTDSDTMNVTERSEEIVDSEQELTMGQKNALASAQSYLSFSAFSYAGLIEQLEFEQYSHEDAVFAVDNCGADWNEQALKSAESYLDFSAFSYTGLIEQLEFEQFTTEQATYAVDNCGADWNEQAAKCAESYLEFASFSREGLIEQLEFEGFTRDQAEYGVKENGY